MFVISFNILYKDLSKKIILTESPYLLVNENIRSIITEIRKIIKDDFLDISDQMKIPANRMALGMTAYTENNMHFFEIDASNVRELNKSIIESSL